MVGTEDRVCANTVQQKEVRQALDLQEKPMQLEHGEQGMRIAHEEVGQEQTTKLLEGQVQPSGFILRAMRHAWRF